METISVSLRSCVLIWDRGIIVSYDSCGSHMYYNVEKGFKSSQEIEESEMSILLIWRRIVVHPAWLHQCMGKIVEAGRNERELLDIKIVIFNVKNKMANTCRQSFGTWFIRLKYALTDKYWNENGEYTRQ